ncbi:EAL domain-containing protein [Propionivibrio dicarboxylicus]|uniref:PAS domain S-box-containing protein/diguanylate cyclase (GGDEF) domain-containing protein n=1 Tax=Propionivibrio dicarboxylicus TaxID=83767 RepID=A0A1G8AJM8_9RHOO|nr:EAL domain-containing protein [Propionivibrio dicarboxylicus]SDH21222.1 PAS domain S-box-containing protein/diguanylate cyclase (GGDEF) domain-containing protein [Propionivibrio dicarboxylicus]
MPFTWSIRRYLLILVLAVTLPLAGLLIYSLHRNYLDVLSRAGLITTHFTEIAAADTARFLHDTRQFLRGLADRPQTRRLDPTQCDPLLAEIDAFFPQFANTAVLDREGQMLCSARTTPSKAKLPSFAQSLWFQQARSANTPHLGTAHIGPVSGKWVVVISEPIPAADGSFTGLVGYSLDLESYHLFGLAADALPAGMSLAVIDGQGRVILRSEKSPEQVGTGYSRADLLAQLGQGSGYALASGANGTQVIAQTTIEGTNWRVVGTRPVAPIFSGVWASAEGQYAAAALLIALGSLLALFVSRRIVWPIRRIADTATKVAEGDLNHRLDAEGPSEIATVATHLNRMLDIRVGAEARFKALLESASDAIVVANQEARITIANERATELFGYSLAELLGMSIHELVPAEARDRHRQEVSRYFAGGTQRTPARLVLGQRKNGQVFPCHIGLSPFEADGVPMVSAIIRDLSERVELEAQIVHQSQHDPLTGLPNRALLNDRLERAFARTHRDGHRVAVIHIDIDNFGEINDFHGTAVADQVLCRCAESIIHSLRGTDSVIRSGSDEFIVIVEDTAADSVALQFGQRLRAALRDLAIETPRAITVTASIGIALFPCEGGADGLLKHADLALAQAQRDGGNTLRFFESEMDARASRRMDVLSRLRGAIGRGELFLHYQPKVCTADGQVIGVEALVRWHNGDIGMIPPSDFIPLAEESGLIDEIGEWVLRRACEQGMRWQAEGLSELSIAVNLSTRQFRQERLLALVRSALEDSGLPPQRLELEITEGMLMQDPEKAAVVLRRLHELGVRISIDDFGTGYSSLSYLQRFPVHTLKVDQSFVREISNSPGAAAIVTAVISLAHSLDLCVVAEGVETEAQRRFLGDLACDYCQGYYFSRPVAAGEISALNGAEPATLPRA